MTARETFDSVMYRVETMRLERSRTPIGREFQVARESLGPNSLLTSIEFLSTYQNQLPESSQCLLETARLHVHCGDFDTALQLVKSAEADWEADYGDRWMNARRLEHH